MTTAMSLGLLTQGARPSVQTGAATGSSLSGARLETTNRARWQAIIDDKLVEWGRDLAALSESDLIPPTPLAIQAAIAVAMQFRDADEPPPARVAPDGDGGVVLERWTGSCAESIEVNRVGRIELVVLFNQRVIQRISLGL